MACCRIVLEGIFHLRVPESAPLGSEVGRIQATDLDAGSNAEVQFAIVPGDDGNMFDVTNSEQSQQGVVVLKTVRFSKLAQWSSRCSLQNRIRAKLRWHRWKSGWTLRDDESQRIIVTDRLVDQIFKNSLVYVSAPPAEARLRDQEVVQLQGAGLQRCAGPSLPPPGPLQGLGHGQSQRPGRGRAAGLH